MLQIDLDKLSRLLLKEKRRRDVTYLQMGHEMGLSGSTLCRIVAKEHLPDLKTISIVAEWMGVDAMIFLKRNDDRKRA